ncbi:MAG: exodeoxyribonuclease large subunit [Frankiales bacterium]|nr:exodeoxyribonuclease large subunit [Frankiales bacterium]MDX6274140.1 exodeoxyribonuclease large subunit [Frankiales bacterium]
MALQSSPEQPLALRTVAKAISDWVGRLGQVWVEGQVTQLNRRPGTSVVFFTLRDTAAQLSLQATCSPATCDAVSPALAEGARVVVLAQPSFYLARGTLALQVSEIRHVGVGELLARLERLKKVLQVEGLFADERKKPLPFLPRTVGLVTGRGSAAERDVVENARLRWPAVRFKVEAVAVQGVNAVPEVVAALGRLDRDREVDVIIVARGGGSVEDLLPFSDEGLVRAAGACATPLVSAIGHETDTPLLDLVADLRASTPTDAGKRVVPDVAEELARIGGLRDRARRVAVGRVDREQAGLLATRSRPCLAEPLGMVDGRQLEVHGMRDRARRRVDHMLVSAVEDLVHTRARVTSLSPQATLERGYAVVQHGGGAVLRSAADVAPGEEVSIRLGSGGLDASVTGVRPG